MATQRDNDIFCFFLKKVKNSQSDHDHQDSNIIDAQGEM